VSITAKSWLSRRRIGPGTTKISDLLESVDLDVAMTAGVSARRGSFDPQAAGR